MALTLVRNDGGNNMPKRLIDDNPEHVCAFCEYGTTLPADMEGNVFVLCKKLGAVVRDTHICRRFSYDPLKREPHGTKALPEEEAKNNK